MCQMLKHACPTSQIKSTRVYVPCRLPEISLICENLFIQHHFSPQWAQSDPPERKTILFQLFVLCANLNHSINVLIQFTFSSTGQFRQMEFFKCFWQCYCHAVTAEGVAGLSFNVVQQAGFSNLSGRHPQDIYAGTHNPFPLQPHKKHLMQ